MVNLYDVYKKVTEELESEFESRELCAYALEIDRNTIFDWKNINITNEKQTEIANLVAERKKGKPIAYILGEWEFYSLPFKVNENVLIPRPDTETLVEEVILEAKENDKILDLCTGSGAIAISIAKNVKNAKLTAVDISSKAIEVAKENAKINEVSIEFIEENVLLGTKMVEVYDIIVSNPPYIPSKDVLELETDVKDYEPRLALDGDEDGLKFYRAICENYKNNLKENGRIYFEYGINQENDVVKILKANGFSKIEIKKDLCGVNRIAKATYIGG